MDLLSAFAIIILAALIHASFQLSVSVLTLLSGHTIGAARSHAKLLRLLTAFIIGAGVMTLLLLSAFSLAFINLLDETMPRAAWIITVGLLIGVGSATWIFYYRKEKGTSLWVPRDIAGHLTERTKAAKRSAEAFGLGMTSVVGELLFIAAPLIASALVVIQLPLGWQLLSVLAYTLISLLPLLIVTILLGGGHKLSQIQKWREKNKRFLQFAAGGGLIILAGFIYVYEVLAIIPKVTT